MKSNKVLIANFENSSSEAEAIRQTLECFGFMVLKINIARPNDFIQILSNETEFDFDYLILSCHGEEGKIIMSILGDEIYFENEPRGNFGRKEIQKYLKLKNKTIISTGCTTGYQEISKVFANNNTYIAPSDYIDGKANLIFIISLLYNLSQGAKIDESYNVSKNLNNETNQFDFFRSHIIS